MKNYFTDYELLGKIIDQLISQKFNNQPPENLESLREESIQKLDDQIGDAVIDSLSREQFDEFNKLLDQEEAEESTFQNFFEQCGIDLNTIMAKTIQNFSTEFLGGENA